MRGRGSRCRARKNAWPPQTRTAETEPILVVRPSEAGPAAGVIKLNGVLVPLASTEARDLACLATGVVIAADGVRMAVRPSPEEGSLLGGLLQRSNAELVFELEQDLTVGYRGFYACNVTMHVIGLPHLLLRHSPGTLAGAPEDHAT